MVTSSKAERRRPLLKIVLAVVVAGLVLDRVHALVSPGPAVGRWRSAAAHQAYDTEYAAAMAQLPVTPQAVDVPTSFGIVHVLRWPGRVAGAPVVLLPGRSSGAPMWVENLPAWIGRRTVYALDPLGDAGRGAQSVPLTRFDEQAEWIAQTLSGLGVRRAHVVGHSFGGATAAVLALRRPQLVADLTLIEPVMVVQNLPASTYVWRRSAACRSCRGRGGTGRWRGSEAPIPGRCRPRRCRG